MLSLSSCSPDSKIVRSQGLAIFSQQEGLGFSFSCLKKRLKVINHVFVITFMSALLITPHPQIIAQHLYHEGRMDVGDVFAAEAGVSDGALLRQRYAALHEVVKQVCE